MNTTILIETSNQCAVVQTTIAQKYETPDDGELICELLKLYHLLKLLFDAKI